MNETIDFLAETQLFDGPHAGGKRGLDTDAGGQKQFAQEGN
jgi:hypothetical protein